VTETQCVFITRDAAGQLQVTPDPNLHVLAQTAADGAFAPVRPDAVQGVQCWRDSIVPGPHDEEVVLALRVPLFIVEDATADPRIGELGTRDGRFRYEIIQGVLAGDEQSRIDARLAEFQARLR